MSPDRGAGRHLLRPLRCLSGDELHANESAEVCEVERSECLMSSSEKNGLEVRCFHYRKHDRTQENRVWSKSPMRMTSLDRGGGKSENAGPGKPAMTAAGCEKTSKTDEKPRRSEEPWNGHEGASATLVQIPDGRISVETLTCPRMHRYLGHLFRRKRWGQ